MRLSVVRILIILTVVTSHFAYSFTTSDESRINRISNHLNSRIIFKPPVDKELSDKVSAVKVTPKSFSAPSFRNGVVSLAARAPGGGSSPDENGKLINKEVLARIKVSD